VLRVEDTDAGRSQDAAQRQLDELRWRGITGMKVGRGRSHGPIPAERRSAVYAEATKLGRTPTPTRVLLGKNCSFAQDPTGRGRPPRYARTCAGLSQAEVQRRIASGKAPAIRFRVPDHRVIEFVDRVHGPQRFQSDDIGDFVIRRADGSVSFFLGNAVDDSAMGITLVLRGDDHLANTPRQLLLLEALGMPLPNTVIYRWCGQRHAAVETRGRGQPDRPA
jgi:glutamyl-tRNA synthetase